jgi:carbon starvation protein
MVFMLVLPGFAMFTDVLKWWDKGQFLLVGVALFIFALEVWLIVEAMLLWPKAKGVLEAGLPPLPPGTGKKVANEGGRSC